MFSLCPPKIKLILWVQPVQRPGKRNCLPHMLQPADPTHYTFNAHAEAAVGNAAVPPQIEIPLECFFRQTVLMNALEQQVVRRHALRAADDLAVTFAPYPADPQTHPHPLPPAPH